MTSIRIITSMSSFNMLSIVARSRGLPTMIWRVCVASFGLCLTTVVLLPPSSVYGEAGDFSLQSYAVAIMNRPAEAGAKSTYLGIGVYLGNGVALTAAHVAGPSSGLPKSVRFGDDLELPATFIK